MPVGVLVFQGLFELTGLSGFLLGYFFHINWLMIAGGILIVLDDIMEILLGVLKPIFPIILAIILVLILKPWYVGIFWASAAFKIINIPTALMKIFVPKRIIAKASIRMTE